MEQGRKRGKRGGMALGEKEKRGLLELVVSLLLFLAVFAGQEAFPDKAELWRMELRTTLQKQTDFGQLFRYLGRSVAEDAPVLETLDAVWAEVIGGEEVPVTEPDRAAAMTLRLEVEEPVSALSRPGLSQKQTVEEDPVRAAVRRELGLEESVTPVLGVLTSGFGVREHPIDGEIKMHEGIDIAADEGTAILAFADGTVDYIGESPAYGMYLQLRHEGGVTTFYAHCSELCVQKGQTVKKGERVAKVGQTGNATGAHLHFEMKKDGEFLDPAPYVAGLTE